MTCCVKPPDLSQSFPSIPPLPNPHGFALILRHYVQSIPHLFDRSSMAKQNLSHRANVICDGSPSRIRMVRRISLGITTRPRSSMRRTIPVAFIYKFPPVKADFSLVVSAVAAVLCTGSFWQCGGIHRKRKALYRTFLGKRQTFRVQL